MKVIIYVEGPSDKYAMRIPLKSLIEEKRQQDITIDFFEAPEGDRKKSVLLKVPIRAINIILNDPQSIVRALPDLYPKNKGFPHETVNQLKERFINRFNEALKSKGVISDERIQKRFHVFCFKYDLEALLLASDESLKQRLRINNLVRSWVVPVEDQNYDKPPKTIIETLFRDNGQHYKSIVDAPIVLRGTTYQYIAEKCPQCFKPFVDFLSSLQKES